MLVNVLATSAAVLSIVSLASAGATINTPSALTQCQPTELTWSGGTAPYFVKIIPGGNPSGTPLVQFPETSATTETWLVNIAAGTSVSIAITDSTGAIAYSDKVSVTAGTSSSCASSAAAGSAAATTSAASAAGGGSASGGATSAGASSAAGAPSGSSSAAASGSSAAASGATLITPGAALAMGAIGALALLA